LSSIKNAHVIVFFYTFDVCTIQKNLHFESLLASTTALTISPEVSPYLTSRSSISSSLADSPKVSLTPILLTGTGYLSLHDSDTADPSPPITLCSSAVIITPVCLAAS